MLVDMPVRYLVAAAVGAAFGVLFVFTFDFAATYMRWVMALLALIGGAKLGAGIYYLFEMAMGDAPKLPRPPRKRHAPAKSSLKRSKCLLNNSTAAASY